MSALTEEEQLAYQADGFVIRRNQFTHSLMAVSYTHLTLPTIYSV